METGRVSGNACGDISHLLLVPLTQCCGLQPHRLWCWPVGCGKHLPPPWAGLSGGVRGPFCPAKVLCLQQYLVVSSGVLRSPMVFSGILWSATVSNSVLWSPVVSFYLKWSPVASCSLWQCLVVSCGLQGTPSGALGLPARK